MGHALSSMESVDPTLPLLLLEVPLLDVLGAVEVVVVEVTDDELDEVRLEEVCAELDEELLRAT